MRKTYSKVVNMIGDVLITLLVIVFTIGFFMIDGISALLLLPSTIIGYRKMVNACGVTKTNNNIMDTTDKMLKQPETIREFVRYIYVQLAYPTDEERQKAMKKFLNGYKRLARV